MVLIYADQTENQIKKSSLEAICYGAKLAEQLGTTAEAVVINHEEQIADLGKYGASKVHLINNENLKTFDAKNYSEALAQVAEKLGAKVMVFSHNSGGKAIAPMLSARLKAGLVTGAVALPDTSKGPFAKEDGEQVLDAEGKRLV